MGRIVEKAIKADASRRRVSETMVMWRMKDLGGPQAINGIWKERDVEGMGCGRNGMRKERK